MTENEAKKWINTLKNWNSILPEAKEACEIAERWFEELQQYRAIGTVEESEKAMDFELAKQDKMLAEVIDDYLKYIKIGTIEEFKDLKEKNEPKELAEHNFQDEVHHYLCPKCRSIVSCTQNYCEECGQALET